MENTASTNDTVAPLPRRRRKRARGTAGRPVDENERPNPANAKTSQTSKSLLNLDDKELTFLDQDGDFLTDRKAIRRSVTFLLEERRIGQWTGKIPIWQRQTLQTTIKKPEKGDPRRQWRSYGKRMIPFTQLGTPHSDAVLSMARQDSFVLCLGTKDLRNAPLALAIRFFGIPSPAMVASSRGYIAPLLQTVPLLYEMHEEESVEDAIFNFRREVSPASTPVKILISRTWKVGIALVQPSGDVSWTAEDGPVGTMVLFSTPKGHLHSSSRVSAWQCVNVKMWGAGRFFNYRNLLWLVESVPVSAVEGVDHDSTYFTCKIHKVPATLFLNDEEDGFRLTWASEHGLDDLSFYNEDLMSSSPLSASVKPSSPILSFEKTWERFDSDRLSGARILPVVQEPIGFAILSEAYLHIEILLQDVLSKRKGMASDQKPTEFFYNLVSVTHGGRVVELIITFIRTQRPGSLGVFVSVDLFTGRYQEQNWVKNVHSQHPSALRLWCNALALNQRMKELRVGPYAVQANHAIDWSRLCTKAEHGFDPDEADSFDPSIWLDYVKGEGALATRNPPKLVSYSSLYPDCDLVTNQAITDYLPAKSLRAKDSPVELVYS